VVRLLGYFSLSSKRNLSHRYVFFYIVKIIHDCLVLWGGSIMAAETFWVIYQFIVMLPGCFITE